MLSAVIGAQIGTAFILLFGTFLFGILPSFLVRNFFTTKTSKYIKVDSEAISFLTYFGGGILFSTCMLQLIPEAREELEHAKTRCNHTADGDSDDMEDVPMTEVMVSVGFFGIYLFEKILYKLLGHDDMIVKQKCHSRSHTVLGCSSSSHRSNENTVPGTYGRLEEELPSTSTELPTPFEESLEHSRQDSILSEEFSFKALILVVALSFHSVFEGLAIGLQPSSAAIWKTFAAVALHKFVLSFAVGLETYLEGMKTSILHIYMILFAVMSPFGILVSIVLTEDIGKAKGYINALAVGSVVYVTFMKILQCDPRPKISGVTQLLAITLGFGIMTAIVILVPNH